MSELNAMDLTAKMKQLEFLGHEVLSAKKRLIDLGSQKNWYREAWRAVQKQNNDTPDGQKKTYIFISPRVFVQETTEKAVTLMKEDLDETEKEIEEMRVELKKNVDELRKFEGKKDLTELGFNLKPVVSRFIDDEDV
uniref:P53 and DNA damage-regulated protein 1 n=1 Tax=Panagrolaimus sp. ES5 TaxID=591445 RepID=A0AC34GXV9_9BILA